MIMKMKKKWMSVSRKLLILLLLNFFSKCKRKSSPQDVVIARCDSLYNKICK